MLCCIFWEQLHSKATKIVSNNFLTSNTLQYSTQKYGSF